MSPREIAHALATAMVELHEDDPALHRVLTDEVPVPPALRDRFDALEPEMVEALAALLRAHPTMHHLRPRVAARLIAGLLESATHRWAVAEGGEPLARDRLVEELAAMGRGAG
ncbi:MAG TPA: hypothetical protein RMH99_14550 [Sandaracinaceae bacterium LLY-WYZ-13_1]|nr:hypothetical protein [Sandaracinaceae bacterium LLY-WYZ-13_1]